MKNADKLFELGRELGALEAQKKTIEEKIKEIKAERTALSGGRREAAGGRRGGGKWAPQVLQVLSAEPEKTFSWTDVAGALGTDKASSIRSTLARLWKEGQVQKEGRGAYKFKKPV